MRYSRIFRQIWIFIFLQIRQGCKVKVGGQNYDLSDLQKEGVVQVTPPKSEQGEYAYEASFCANLITCMGSEGNFVQLRDNNLQHPCIGRYGNWSTAVSVKTANGFDAKFESSEPCAGNYDKHYSSTFKFLCDESAGTLGTIEAEKVGDNTCSYSVSVYTKLVCAGSTPVPNPTSRVSGGLSVGSIFLIALLCALFMYIILGIGLNYRKEQSYKTPHKDFWCSNLPYWTKIGCITSWIWTLWFSQQSYSWCCTHICKRQTGEDDKMATGLIDGKEDSS